MSLAANHVLHSKINYIGLYLYFVCEKVLAKQIIVNHISSHEKHADFFTKGLPASRFLFLQGKHNVRVEPLSLRRDIGGIIQNEVGYD